MKTSDLRIVFLSDAIRGRNGVGTYYEDLVEHLREHVAQAELLCPTFPRSADYHSFSFSLPGDRTQRLCFPKFWRTRAIVKEIDPHVIVVPIPGPYGLLGRKLSQRLDIPLCIGFHTDYGRLAEMYWNRIIGKICRKGMGLVNARLFRTASVVVANSAAMVECARDVGAHTIRLVGTPIAKHFLSEPARPLPSEFGAVLYAGRLAPEKNIGKVIDAAETIPDVTFRIAGEGPQRRLVEEQARSLGNLEYLGWVTRSEMVGVLDKVDMLVLPSKVESFGTVALEAMARGRLVLVSAGCGIRQWESLSEGIFQMQEGESVADAVRRIRALDLSTKEQTARFARRSAEVLVNQTIDQWLDIFAGLSTRTFAVTSRSFSLRGLLRSLIRAR